MLRRNVSLALVAMIALQLLGGMVFASVCLEPCPDDTEETSCPPVCAVCTTCTHGQKAVVRHASAGLPTPSTRRFVLRQHAGTSLPLADDIFHVPLGA
ncbi:MAG TPA: hypothetical protein VEK57_26680 [Thermoanaerobaculia bacterium]|nr:hypothetical protein [Thermoanaerobaculia bacterium]